MQKTDVSLFHLWQKCRSGYLTGSELRALIEIVLRLSVAYLKFKQRQGLHLTDIKDNTKHALESIALDAVADLFERDEHNCLIRLKHYFQSLQEPIDCQETALLHLRRLVTARTRQGLYRIFRERDPESAKLLRNLKLAAEQSDTLRTAEDIRGILIYSGADAPPPVRMPTEPMMGQIYRHMKPEDTVPQLLQKMWDILNADASAPFSLRLHDVITMSAMRCSSVH
ncbi:MAG: hypothetical protein U5R06_09505 [candidate division KSB1 bacterium]|nr:hypothetical protein [candidate division KSB1 bacterium]